MWAKGWIVAFMMLLLLGGVAWAGEPGRMVDHNGAPVTEEQFGSDYRLLYFGYSHCPDACPVALQTMSDALDRLGRIGEMIAPVFISVDPERDTPAFLKRYVDMFHPRFKAVSGDITAIKALADRYRVVFVKVDTGNDRPYTMDHSTSIYLTDAKGNQLGRFPHTLTAAELANRILGRIARQ